MARLLARQKMETFHEEHDVRRSAGRMLSFIAVFTPVFFFGIYIVLREYPVPFPNSFVYTCSSVPVLIAIGFNMILFRSSHPLQWKMTDSRIIYESPSFLLGKSFNIEISDLNKMSDIGDTDFGSCVTSSGSSFKFHRKHRGGRAFSIHLEEYLKTKRGRDSATSCP